MVLWKSRLAEPADASPFCYNTGMESLACAGCRERDRLIADLRRRTSQLDAQVERLTRLLEKAQRDGKRQAAPFAKGPPRPGRKPGPGYGPKAHRQPPAHIDEVHEAPLPEVCPDCGGPLDETRIAQ